MIDFKLIHTKKKLRNILLSSTTDFKSISIKEDNNLTYFNIFLFDNLTEKNSFDFFNIALIFENEKKLIFDFIEMNYMKSGSFIFDDIIYLNSNKGKATSFEFKNGLAFLTVGDIEISFPSLKYLSDFLNTGESIFYDENLLFKSDFISGLFYI